MPGLPAAIHPDLGRLSEGSYDHIYAPISIQVGESAATMTGRRGSRQSSLFSQGGPFPAWSQVAEDGVVLIHGLAGEGNRFDVAATDK